MDQDNRKYFVCKQIKFRYILNLFISERIFKKNKIVLCYLNSNRISSFLEKNRQSSIKKYKHNFSFLHLNYDVLQMKDEKGIPITRVSSHDDLNKVINKIDRDSDSSLLDCLNDKFNIVKEDLKLYIKQYITLVIYYDLLLANTMVWLAKNNKSEVCRKNPIMLVETHSYWSTFVLDLLKTNNIKLKVFNGINLKNNKMALFLYHLTKLFVEVIRSFFMGNRAAKFPKEARIGIPFYSLQNFTDYDIRNYYLFWFYKSQIDPEKILIYIPGAEMKISDEEISNIKKAKFKLIFCPTRLTKKNNGNVRVHICTFKVIALLVKYLKQIIKMHKYAKDRFMKEQWKILSLLFIQLPYWEDFFQSNNIKIKFRFHDIFSLREIAAKLSGAITLSYHYTNHLDTTIAQQEICDVFFIWGKRYEKCLLPEHSTTKHLIQTGYIFDYTFKKLKSKAIALKNTFEKSNVSYVIVIFNENIKGYAAKSQMDCFALLLKYVESYSDTGVIFKPKHPKDFGRLRSVPEINNLMNILEKQGRIKILDSNKHPVEAGLSSVMAIGTTPDSTAGMECALSGIPMVIYDCTNSKAYHPYYSWGYNKVIFDDMRELLSSLSRNKTMSGRMNGFADWSSVLNTIDPFRDGKANQRVGMYIETLLLELEKGSSKDEAIKGANKVYGNEFGRDKVASLH